MVRKGVYLPISRPMGAVVDNLELDAEPEPIAAVLKDAALHLDMPGVGRLNGSVLWVDRLIRTAFV